jgi:1-aminocyclopropane-1-carboxylate deaminase/D-cysteine desulfhydrase-like pyridoxal-dependent ACC family enzyme
MTLTTSFLLPSPLQEISDEHTQKAGIQIFLKRDDLIHPIISGNKWRKLELIFEDAENSGASTLLSFGGPYSNHLHALAFAANEFQFKSIGIVRANENEALTPTLSDCQKWNMQLWKPGRALFDNRHSPEFLNLLKEKFGDFYLIDDGGDHPLAEKNCGTILSEIPLVPDHVCCPVGTGTTLRGIAKTAISKTQLHGYLCSSGTSVIEAKVPSKVRLTSAFCEGGFAKKSERLTEFMKWFEHQHGIKLDAVYNGKMMMGIYEEMKRGMFRKGETVVAVNTGGQMG